MEWLGENWQTVAARAVVALTVTIFALKLARPTKKSGSGCGEGCGCDAKSLQEAGKK
jgi:hypothetical protein